MKMKKLTTLGIVLPMFATCVSCNRGIAKISYDKALSFAVEHYDPYAHLGYSPIYNLKVNLLALKNTKIYQRVIKDETQSYEQVYYIDTSVRDLSTTIDTDEIGIIHVSSRYVGIIAQYLSIASSLLGYIDSSFTLEDDKYLGVYLKSNKIEQVLGIIPLVLPMVLEDAPKVLKQISFMNASKADIKITASCNNLGMLDRVHAYLDLHDLAVGTKSNRLGLITASNLAANLDLVVDY